MTVTDRANCDFCGQLTAAPLRRVDALINRDKGYRDYPDGTRLFTRLTLWTGPDGTARRPGQIDVACHRCHIRSPMSDMAWERRQRAIYRHVMVRDGIAS